MSEVISPDRGSASDKISEGEYEVRFHENQDWRKVTVERDDKGLYFKSGPAFIHDSEFHDIEFREVKTNE